MMDSLMQALAGRSFAEFLDMGGYALWVWGAWGAVILALGGLSGWIALDNRRTRHELEALEARHGRKRAEASTGDAKP